MSTSVCNQIPAGQVTEAVQAVPANQKSSLVTVENGQVVTTSFRIAEIFGKQHKDVIRSVKSLECSEDFRRRNFAPSKIDYENGNIRKQLPMFYITRDGFMFLVMGFTGKTAARYKEAYIKAFNDMEAKLRGEQAAQVQAPAKQFAKPSHTMTELPLFAKEEPRQELGGGIIEVYNGRRVISSRTLAKLTGRRHGDVMASIQRTFKYAKRPAQMFFKSDDFATLYKRQYYITAGGFDLMSYQTKSISREIHQKVRRAFNSSKNKNVTRLSLLPQPTPPVATMPKTPTDLMQRFVNAMSVMMGIDANEMFNLMGKGGVK